MQFSLTDTSDTEYTVYIHGKLYPCTRRKFASFVSIRIWKFHNVHEKYVSSFDGHFHIYQTLFLIVHVHCKS